MVLTDVIFIIRISDVRKYRLIISGIKFVNVAINKIGKKNSTSSNFNKTLLNSQNVIILKQHI
jgi:hypothetical protein